MNKRIIPTLMALILVLTLVNVSAVQYWQTKEFVSGNGINSRIFYGWDVGDIAYDHIKSGNKLEAYLLYDVYTSKWNRDNPDYAVDKCNLTILFYDTFSKETNVVYNQIFTGATEDVSMDKYFVEMAKGDNVIFNFNCSFSGTRPELLEMPITMSVVTPTWECKACQSYQWSKLEIDVAKAKTIGDNSVEIMGFIKALILLNYEFIIIIFWIFLISIGWFTMSLIFIGVYWLYLYLRGVSRIK